MIRIGDFARLGRVSVVTLRHYDEIGLLKPEYVDRTTGYRHYSVRQLARLNRIIALKDLGFSLKQIEQVLDGLTVGQLAGMLKMKRAQAEQSLASEQAKLQRIESRLLQIEMEDRMPDYDIVLKTTAPQQVSSRRITVPQNNEVPHYLGAAYEEVSRLISVAGAKQDGPCLTVWHQPADVVENEDVEAIIPVNRAIVGNDRVKVYELPATEVAAVVFHGSLEGLEPAHLALLSWMENNGYRMTGTYREIYHANDRENPANTVTEIQYPVERAS
jgi:DNA-binding transcriptional MerR regulator